MVQLQVLTGKQAGTYWVARRFPVRIGRSGDCDLKMDEEGVWNEHLTLMFKNREGFLLRTESGALSRLNGEPFLEGMLKNGDLIEIGSLKLRFWLSAVQQAGLAWREWLTWILVALISLAQVLLVYWLIQL